MTYHAKIYGGGKMAIPADVRRALGIKDGDRVTLDIEDGRLTVKTQAQLIKEIQAYFKSFVPEGVSLVDELISERRAEAAREQA
jgi:AbrB family transcriptional regulator, stage V sporulation protein T